MKPWYERGQSWNAYHGIFALNMVAGSSNLVWILIQKTITSGHVFQICSFTIDMRLIGGN